MASLIPPPPFGRGGPFTSAGMVVPKLKETQATRLVVAFCPTWTVSKLMQFADDSKNFDVGNWTWIFSDFGNKKVKYGV